MQNRVEQLAKLMQTWGYLEDPPPVAALRWIELFLKAYSEQLTDPKNAEPLIAALRNEATIVPALELERLRSRSVLFFLDSIAQYVDRQEELRDLPLAHDIAEIAKEFGLNADDALDAARVALTGKHEGPPLELLFPLLGHDRIMMRIGAVSSHLLHGRGLEPIKYGPDGKPFEPLRGKQV